MSIHMSTPMSHRNACDYVCADVCAHVSTHTCLHVCPKIGTNRHDQANGWDVGTMACLEVDPHTSSLFFPSPSPCCQCTLLLLARRPILGPRRYEPEGPFLDEAPLWGPRHTVRNPPTYEGTLLHEIRRIFGDVQRPKP